MARPHCVVVGAGVSGLTTAHALQDCGWAVEVRARSLGQAPAHALWECPAYLFEPQREGCEWALESLREFRRIASSPDGAASGVHETACVYLSREALPARPHSADLPGYCRGAAALASPELAAVAVQGNGYTDAELYRGPVLDSPRYLRWLRASIEARGGRVRLGAPVPSLAEAAAGGGCRLVVNCAGASAGALAGDDDACFPCRGQVAVVHQPQVRAAIMDEETGAYCIPLPGTGLLELGGTAEDGVPERRLSSAATAEVLRKCSRMIPSLAGAAVRDAWVGIRPKRRGGCRVELRRSAGVGVPVLHNYGHGGAGYIVSWGSARAAARLVAQTGGPARPPRGSGLMPRL
eukprot:TRINITY_DN9047_c0_g1_i1.p2 TRINITY_DN9047_c0_g1~~TRINITY_DN9047_c0_g1_i1.p2  ORF type:complete len:350 (+),score=56.38 TRINITY_DN9047_c0_g1_i1:75-1124(+)